MIESLVVASVVAVVGALWRISVQLGGIKNEIQHFSEMVKDHEARIRVLESE